ncbi:hypothetical protein RND71_031969 [Anisodus tanguticus]|uniref:Uncharacterized protein n=1 Tax=Anisodus tanguticus TaxID=243964 RepID=A0AAE1RBQ4_9SOLA|nr:hypothetical protein RND71_031969 [Anisodus tanguticus]
MRKESKEFGSNNEVGNVANHRRTLTSGKVVGNVHAKQKWMKKRYIKYLSRVILGEVGENSNQEKDDKIETHNIFDIIGDVEKEDNRNLEEVTPANQQVTQDEVKNNERQVKEKEDEEEVNLSGKDSPGNSKLSQESGSQQKVATEVHSSTEAVDQGERKSTSGDTKKVDAKAFEVIRRHHDTCQLIHAEPKNTDKKLDKNGKKDLDVHSIIHNIQALAKA